MTFFPFRKFQLKITQNLCSKIFHTAGASSLGAGQEKSFNTYLYLISNPSSGNFHCFASLRPRDLSRSPESVTLRDRYETSPGWRKSFPLGFVLFKVLQFSKIRNFTLNADLLFSSDSIFVQISAKYTYRIHECK